MKTIKVGDEVLVSDPNLDDIWNHGFCGTVIAINNNIVSVCDGDDEVFDVDISQIELDI